MFFSFYACFLYFYFIRKKKQYKPLIFLGPLILPVIIVFGYKSLNVIEGFLYLSKSALGLQRPAWATAYTSWDWHLINLVENSGLEIIVYIGLIYSILLILCCKSKRDGLIFLLLMILIPLVIISVPRIGVSKYSYFILPLFILFISYGLAIMLKFITIIFIKTRHLNIFFILIFTGLIISTIYVGYEASNHPPWAKNVHYEEASEIIKSNSDENTTVIINFMTLPLGAYGVNINYICVERGIDYLKMKNGKHIVTGTEYVELNKIKGYIEENGNIIVAIRPWPSDITPDTYDYLNMTMIRIDDESTSIDIYKK